MGEVYKSRDTRLNRFVAVKVLPPERLADEGRKRRFMQEAQAASALNHPNIITVYDIAVDNGRDYMVMEYVPGKTLDALIPRTGMRLAESLKIAIQVAEGLSAAHAAGIVHRDIKPSNIMVSDTGVVKILDFGLAKLTEPGEVREDDVTRTRKPKTEAGTVMGTAAYMSPEQAEGKPVDARSDIFSFGAVLYEMATGGRAFRGDSRAATMAAVLGQEPRPLGAAAPDLPREFERVVMRCLRKDPGKRQQHMTDVKVLLEELKEESESGKLATTAAAKTPRRRWPWVAAGAAVVILAGAAGLWLTGGRDNQPPHVVPLTTTAGSENFPSFSPDGNQVVFSWNGEKQDNWDLYVKMIGSATALRLTTDPTDDLYPSWSPDGRQIAFLKYGQRSGIYLISPLGGPEQKIVDFDAARGAPAWSPDGAFLLVAKAYREERPGAGTGALFLIPVQGGEPRPVLDATPGRWYLSPVYAPAARSLAFASCGGSPGAPFCEVLLVGVNANLLPQGKPRRLAEAAAINGLAWTADGRSLVYGAIEQQTVGNLWSLDVAGGGAPKRLEISSQGASFPAVAPKGNRLAFSRATSDVDIWRLEPGGHPQPFLVSSMLDASPHFSPDGRRIAFASGRGPPGIAIWLSNADGGGLMQLTRGPEDYHGSPRWSPDGRWIALDARGQERRWNIKVVESAGGQPRQLTSGPFSSCVPTWSADGKWIYFGSDRTGRFEIWRVPAAGGAAVQVSRDGGYMAVESPDGGTLYYTKTSGIGPLYARPPGGGEEKQVLEHVPIRGFAVFHDGIYYFDYQNFGGPQKYAIRFHEFSTGRSRVVSHMEGPAGIALTVSPDRKTFLFGWQTATGRDLMLIENFR